MKHQNQSSIGFQCSILIWFCMVYIYWMTKNRKFTELVIHATGCVFYSEAINTSHTKKKNGTKERNVVIRVKSVKRATRHTKDTIEMHRIWPRNECSNGWTVWSATRGATTHSIKMVPNARTPHPHRAFASLIHSRCHYKDSVIFAECTRFIWLRFAYIGNCVNGTWHTVCRSM